MRAPLVFLGAVVLLLGYGAWKEHRPRSFAEAVAVLLDGTPDRDERLAMLRIVARRGESEAKGRGDALPAVQAAVAALLLGDAQPLRRGRDLLASLSNDQVLEAALDEPSVEHLLRGYREQRAGRDAAAKTAFAQAEASGRLFGLDGVVELARAM